MALEKGQERLCVCATLRRFGIFLSPHSPRLLFLPLSSSPSTSAMSVGFSVIDVVSLHRLPPNINYAREEDRDPTQVGPSTLGLLSENDMNGHRIRLEQDMLEAALQPLIENFDRDFNAYLGSLPLDVKNRIVSAIRIGLQSDTIRAKEEADGQLLDGELGLQTFLFGHIYAVINHILRESHLVSGGNVRLYWRVVGGGQAAGRPDIELVLEIDGEEQILAVIELKTINTMSMATSSALFETLQYSSMTVYGDGDVKLDMNETTALPTKVSKMMQQVSDYYRYQGAHRAEIPLLPSGPCRARFSRV